MFVTARNLVSACAKAIVGLSLALTTTGHAAEMRGDSLTLRYLDRSGVELCRSDSKRCHPIQPGWTSVDWKRSLAQMKRLELLRATLAPSLIALGFGLGGWFGYLGLGAWKLGAASLGVFSGVLPIADHVVAAADLPRLRSQAQVVIFDPDHDIYPGFSDDEVRAVASYLSDVAEVITAIRTTQMSDWLVP